MDQIAASVRELQVVGEDLLTNEAKEGVDGSNQSHYTCGTLTIGRRTERLRARVPKHCRRLSRETSLPP